ncbi:MAG TPA: thiamine pyrophosphate-dependent enzyme, partial [Burkholderiales bacterium]|nr:thiamine pyrophosphate-dependent enzyme [Burkholderiales bacterium]
MTTRRKIVLERRAVVARILRDRGGALVIPGLGAPTWDAAAAGDSPLTFQMWGAMGGTAMMALGLALAQPKRRVLALPGDGDMLMGLGSLAVIGTQGPPNLVVAVIDNERYGETGMQETHTARGVDLPAIARASGFRATATVYTMKELEAAMPLFYRKAGPVFISIKVTTQTSPNVLPPR